MRRILFVTRDISYPGGSEEFIKNLLLIFGEKDLYKLFLLEIEGHGKFENRKIYHQLEKVGIKILSIKSDTEDIASLDKALKLQKIIKDKKIDIVHSFLFNADFLVCIAKIGSTQMWKELTKIRSWKTFCKIIPSLHNLGSENVMPMDFKWVSSKLIDVSIALEKNTEEWKKRKRIIDNEVEGIVSLHADVVLPVYKKGVTKWNKLSKKTILLPCTSITKNDLSEIEKRLLKRELLRKKYRISPEELAFVTVSRLVPEKGIDRLMDLFQSDQKYSLHIAGSGILEKELKKKSKKFKNVHILGYLPRSEIFDLLVAGNIFILLSDSEGFPLSIQEAMAAGKPILTTKAGGNSDLVSNLNGRLCRVNNLESINKNFKWFLERKNKEILRMGLKSRNIIEKYFITEKIADKLSGLYLKI